MPAKKHPTRTSPRAPWWNYGWDGAYFITVITHERLMLFGDVVNGQMVPSAVGRIASQCWNDIVKHARNIELGEFVVMPNHIHGILILKNNRNFVITRTIPERLATTHLRYRNQGRNTISSIVGSYKSAVTKLARRQGYAFAWQPRFHDHIIRSDNEYRRIERYIHSNPRNWGRKKRAWY